MDIGIDDLRMVICPWVDDEAIVGMYVSSFVCSVVTGTDAPRRRPSRVAKMAAIVAVREIWRRRHGIMHEMGNVLASAVGI